MGLTSLHASSLGTSLALLLSVGACAGCSKSSSSDPISSPSTSTTASTTASTTTDASTDAGVPHSPGGDVGLALTHARTAVPSPKGLSMIAVSQKEIRLVATKKVPIPMPPANQWYAGMPLAVKDKEGSMFIVPIAEWLKDIRKGQERDLAVVFDNAVTYRIVTEVLYTAAVSGFDRFHVVALTPIETYGEMLLEMPGFRPDAGIAPPFATILIAPEGISIKTETNNVGAGCGGFGPGLAFPRVNGVIDVIGLPSCLDRITPDGGTASPDIVVGGTPETTFGDVASVMDGVRARRDRTVLHLGMQRTPPPPPLDLNRLPR